MNAKYDRINSLWAEWSRPLTSDDIKKGWTAEVIRWCRDRLGGRDQDLVGPEHWEKASREGWSVDATYARVSLRGDTWKEYVHQAAHFVWTMLPARFGDRNYDSHSPEHARIELELTELVVGWLTDEAQGIKRTFPPLVLSRPPDLRNVSDAGRPYTI